MLWAIFRGGIGKGADNQTHPAFLLKQPTAYMTLSQRTLSTVRVSPDRETVTWIWLMQLLGDPDGWKVLPEPFSSLWLSWDGSRQSTTSPADQGQEEHIAFIRSLVLPDTPAHPASASSSRSSPADTTAANGKHSPVISSTQQSQLQAVANSAQEQQQTRQSIHMREAWQAWQQTPEGSRWKSQRGSLPVHQIRAGVLSALQESDFVVVMGDTGSGKTTQVRQLSILQAFQESEFILDVVPAKQGPG